MAQKRAREREFIMCFRKLTAVLLSVCILLFAFACGIDTTQTTPNSSSQVSTENTSESVLNGSTWDSSSILQNSSINENSSSITEDSSVQDSSVFEDSSVQDSSTTQKPDDVLPPIDYDGITKAEFYANYTVAVSSEDAKKRSEYGLMSGSLQTPDQAPEIADNRPMSGDLYLRNSQMLYSEDNQAYTVLYLSGEVAFTVYYGGAYITLEEVAAYVYAFGEIPANYTSKKSGSSTLFAKWGEYLRLNHSAFTGSTYRYPYEPELPNISGCGGTLQYYEMDIGTTGTDCDPKYDSVLYNNGSTITRGAARIVYGKQDLNGNGIYELNEFHLFYTYNHYNDFQEYLNYYGGWGEMFGNITGGGSISSKSDYNPTPYVSVVFADIFAN